MTCACVDYWAIVLPQLEALSGIEAVALHGKMKQVLSSKPLYVEPFVTCISLTNWTLKVELFFYWLLDVEQKLTKCLTRRV